MADNTRGMEAAEASMTHIARLITKYNETQSDEILQELQELPLSVDIRSGWYDANGNPATASEFRIVLSTGGPAVRIYGGIEANGRPYDPEIQGQDWGTEWESLILTDEKDKQALEQFTELMFP